MKEGKYIKFLMEGTSKSGKTQNWRVVAKKDEDDILGYIRWHGPWRCYIFSAFCGRIFQTTPIFEKRCLRDIADFIDEQTKAHKLTLPNKKSTHGEMIMDRDVDATKMLSGLIGHAKDLYIPPVDSDYINKLAPPVCNKKSEDKK